MDGAAHLFGDDINTDYIISSRRKRDTVDPGKLARFLMEDIKQDFGQTVEEGDFIVAGRNFGCGSSMEIAPLVIRAAGIRAVLALSFGRIFFRNCINIGFPALTCPTTRIQEGDRLELNPALDRVLIVNRGIELPINPLPELCTEIIRVGGIIPYMKKLP
ncbi:MAG: 3-isopropylmalate dehydratase [Deltaproteobacteria bacterium]|nr:3-isopropylmalate dehydratase [Deltaproteobacteria bacterium]MBW2305835.1 3-isopropylmalate dehydratase [Deltaproteobacteria bacterium]